MQDNLSPEPRDTVAEPIPPPPQWSRHETHGGPVVRLDAHAFSRLERLARSQGVSPEQALIQLIATGTSHLERENPRSLGLPLSLKQKEVLECLNAGMSVKEIGVHMGIKEGTVRTHILRLRGSLDCSDLLSLRFQ